MIRPTTVSDLASAVRDARERGTPLRIVGRGTWLGAGGTVRPDAERVETSGLSGIREYVPGDLTLTAGAGTTLAELDAATTAHGQWCPLLPWGTDDATLGAVFATATGGPFARALGRPRDLALGIEFVDGSGAVLRGGGRVVKNVAGFDLTRLLVGSWGTLGIITEVSVRLRARPRVDETWVVELDAADAGVHGRLDALDRGPYAPLASSRLGDSACRRLGLSMRAAALVRIGGNASLVAATRSAVLAVSRAEPCDPSAWSTVRALDLPENSVAVEGVFGSPVARRLKQRFDPRNILNPGVLGEAAA